MVDTVTGDSGSTVPVAVSSPRSTEREWNLGVFMHPDHLALPTGPKKRTVLSRVDHPDAVAFAAGDGTLGWEGDSRLCLYADPKADRWLLVRLEVNGQYSPCRASTPGQRLNREWVVATILDLMRTDVRRGWTPEAMMAADEAHDLRLDAEFDEWVREDFADRLRTAVNKGSGTRTQWGSGSNARRKEKPKEPS